MKVRTRLALSVMPRPSGCGPRDEFKHETVEAYQADSVLRQGILQRCADHLIRHATFATPSDTGECRKAVAADQHVRLAQHMARERAASDAALASAARQFEGR